MSVFAPTSKHLFACTILSIGAFALSACQGGATTPAKDATPMRHDAEQGVVLDGGEDPADAQEVGDALDTGSPDAGEFDAEAGDTGELDAEAPNPDAAQPDAEAPAADASLPDSGRPPRPIVILMIGDGMGKGQLEAASIFGHGQPEQLFMQSLPHRGPIETGSLSGITDSAAAATALATGIKTYNASIGRDRYDNPIETIVERAQNAGLGAGVVSTASLPHATPAGFSAHSSERHQYIDIANSQARDVRPFVALGGGAQFYNRMGTDSLRNDQGLIDPLIQAGWQYVYTSVDLAAASPANGGKLLGIFAPEHLDFVKDRAANTTQPTLTEMSLKALEFLDSYESGFFLMIEGARIDMASHSNDLERAIGETLAFDDAVRAVATWADTKTDDITIIVTADHECGGLDVITANGAGTLPTVSWRWLQHTNARITAFGRGPGSEMLETGIHDHTWIHALMVSELFREAFVSPPLVLTPDGQLDDLRHAASTQAVASAFGPDYNRLDTLRLDADENGLFIGVEGLFRWGENALVILLDRDFGAATGPASMSGAFNDNNGRVDSILSSLVLTSANVPGFGADFALVTWGGSDPKLDESITDAGLRGLRPPLGQIADLGWYSAAINFGEDVRTHDMIPGALLPGEGFETFIPWATIYDLAGMVPTTATVAIAAVLVNDDGGYTSNQALPPFAAAQTMNPGSVATQLPGLIVFPIDADGDGIADGATAPSIIPASP